MMRIFQEELCAVKMVGGSADVKWGVSVHILQVDVDGCVCLVSFFRWFLDFTNKE